MLLYCLDMVVKLLDGRVHKGDQQHVGWFNRKDDAALQNNVSPTNTDSGCMRSNLLLATADQIQYGIIQRERMALLALQQELEADVSGRIQN